MARFDRHLVILEENKRLQQRIKELEEANQKLNNKNDFIREIANLLINNNNNNKIKFNDSRQDTNITLDQVIDLIKDLSSDIKNLFKN